MTPEEKAKQVQEDLDKADRGRADKARADSEVAGEVNEKLKQILEHLDSLGKRMDSYEASRAATGADEKGDLEEEIEKDKPKPLAADSQMDASKNLANSLPF